MVHLTSILLPSLNRPHRLSKCLTSLFGSIGDQPVEVVLSLANDDTDSLSVGVRYPTRILYRTRAEVGKGAIWAWNQCLGMAKGDRLVLAADDLDFFPGWLDKSLAVLLEGGLVGFNDLHSNGENYAAHWVADRGFLDEHNGGLMYPPCYVSWWADWEMTDKAKAIGKYVWAKDAIVSHPHWSFTGSYIPDETYREAVQYHEQDHQTYLARKAAGFPTDWEPELVR